MFIHDLHVAQVYLLLPLSFHIKAGSSFISTVHPNFPITTTFELNRSTTPQLATQSHNMDEAIYLGFLAVATISVCRYVVKLHHAQPIGMTCAGTQDLGNDLSWIGTCEG